MEVALEIVLFEHQLKERLVASVPQLNRNDSCPFVVEPLLLKAAYWKSSASYLLEDHPDLESLEDSLHDSVPLRDRHVPKKKWRIRGGIRVVLFHELTNA